jgi:hypothetical protein
MLVPPGYGAVTRPIAMRLAPALVAAASTLLAGMTGPARPGAWQMLDSAALMAVTGLLLAGTAGLLACHLAQLTVRPAPSLSASALPAALIAGAVPGLGVAALFVPLGLCVRWRSRPAALFGLLGAAAGIGSIWLDSPVLGTSASLAMLAAASLLLRDAVRPATNDNRPVERFGAFWILPDNDRHAKRASSPGLGE